MNGRLPGLCIVFCAAFVGWAPAAEQVSSAEPARVDFVTQVAPIFTKYCTGCHNDQDREGKLSLRSFVELQRGGENGGVVLSGQPESSRLIRVLTGEIEPRMPPEGERAPTADEIEVLKAWIRGGAKGPMGAEMERRNLLTPTIAAAAGAAERVLAVAYAPDGNLLALARFGAVELRDTRTGERIRSWENLPGKVNAVHFSHDGGKLIAATGISGLYGVAVVWNVGDGQLVREFEGHLDTLYDAELSPDGKLLATCSYDRKVVLWDAVEGKQLRVLDGHNDAVYDIAFSPDAAVLASASGDKTVKIWSVATGERLDTLSQPLSEQYVVAFSPDGRCVLAAGGDSRIRVWELVSRDKPRINPLVYARFAHEGAILALAFSADGNTLVSAAEDQTVKLWETKTYTQRVAFERQSDQVVDIAFAPAVARFTVARLDGSIGHYALPVEGAGTTRAREAEVILSAAGDMAPLSEAEEREPNDRPLDAMRVQAPVRVRGAIDRMRDEQSRDADLFRFVATAGQTWMIDVNAARQKSPLDSRVEVLDAQGQPVPRVVLQAVRDSYFTFRGKDFDTSDDFRVFNWQEMEINEFLYADGEVVKLWHYPRGPDSGFIVYPGRGRRWNWFDTTPLSHALGAPCYIVEPHAPRTTVIPNGLPAFTVYYENDDDAWRQWGSDSRLQFVAPADGEYLVRVTDSRGFEGADFKYELSIRVPQPDFQVRVEGGNPKVSAGGGKEFVLQVERLDAFDGEIRIDVENLPPGFHASTPILVQAGQSQALATINARPDAPPPTPEQAKASRLYATATIGGQTVRKDAGTLGEIQLVEKPKLLVRLLPAVDSGNSEPSPTVAWDKPLELEMSPGETITAKVKVERNGFNDRIPFGNFDAGRNLPHGVFVDNIGLNGLMIVEGQDERIFFITAAKWAPAQTRLFHLQAQVEGNQTSWPVRLRIR